MTIKTPSIELIEYTIEQLIHSTDDNGDECYPGRLDWFRKLYGPEGQFEFRIEDAGLYGKIVKFYYDFTASIDPTIYMMQLGSLIAELNTNLSNDFIVTTTQSAVTIDELAYIGLRVDARKQTEIPIADNEIVVCDGCNQEVLHKHSKKGKCFPCYIEHVESLHGDFSAPNREKQKCASCGELKVYAYGGVCQDCQSAALAMLTQAEVRADRIEELRQNLYKLEESLRDISNRCESTMSDARALREAFNKIK